MADMPVDEDVARWYALRDLRRVSCNTLAYSKLGALGVSVFTPLHWITTMRGGRKIRREVPVVGDLLFAHGLKNEIARALEEVGSVQFRYKRGGRELPMTVRDADMNMFITATHGRDDARYYLPDEVTPDMYGRRVRITGGLLDGYEGYLLYVRGSRVKRLMVEIPGFLTAAVEVEPDYIQLL